MTLTAKEALSFILDWKPASDMYAFHYNNIILSSSAALSAVYINYRFRRALKLRNFAFISTYTAAVCIPVVSSAVLHGLVVVKPMITRQGATASQCPVCLESKSGLIQMMGGVLYPMILSPLASIPFADRYMTIAVPSVMHEPKLVLEMIAKMLRPVSKTLLIITVAQGVLGMAVAHWEFSNLFGMIEKILAMETAVKAKISNEEWLKMKEEAVREDANDLDIERPKPKYVFGQD